MNLSTIVQTISYNLCWGYRLALLYEIKTLREFCKQRISVNAKKLFATADFMQCDREVLLQILKVSTLNCSDIELLDACVSWAEAACQRKNVNDK